MIWRWLLGATLLLISGWSMYMALFNWWAAGGPPSPHPETYAFRGNVFFGLACLLFVAFVVVAVTNYRRRKRQT